MSSIHWTDYLKYKSKLRGFNLEIIENIIKFSKERYFDNSTHRSIVIGKHNKILVMIPYEESPDNIITPVTIHATSRQQINYRLKCGRFRDE